MASEQKLILTKNDKNKSEFSLTFEDAAEATEVHLVGAVEDDDVLPETSPHVLHCLSLPGARGAGGRASHRHPQGLGKGDVASGKREIVMFGNPSVTTSTSCFQAAW